MLTYLEASGTHARCYLLTWKLFNEINHHRRFERKWQQEEQVMQCLQTYESVKLLMLLMRDMEEPIGVVNARVDMRTILEDGMVI